MGRAWLFRALFLTAMIGGGPAFADDALSYAIRKGIEGTWILEEWNLEGAVVRPPEATGRLSLHDDAIVIMGSRTRFGQTKSFFAYGSYVVGESSWSYGYGAYNFLQETPSKISISKELPWQGLRRFQARTEGDKLILDYDGGKAQIVISGNDFIYNENGTLVRRWKRIAP
ncbi:hypothetical protein [Hypericibacter sp.]|uniref:hypothetical protein n=1 Tax=Hypericibacter sp. TaxID=2705401 RepID=UPI003D6D311A